MDKPPDPRIDALAAALDHHWLESSVAQGFARCTCGEWRLDIADWEAVPRLGEHFAPFSGHVAAAILAAPPPDWCGHADLYAAVLAQNHENALFAKEIARLRKIEGAARAHIAWEYRMPGAPRFTMTMLRAALEAEG